MAPPEIAITISPEISFERSGIFWREIVKIKGNILAAPSPTINIEILAINNDGAKIIAIILIREKTMDQKRNFLAEIQFNKTAPEKRPIITDVKYILIPSEACSRERSKIELR